MNEKPSNDSTADEREEWVVECEQHGIIHRTDDVSDAMLRSVEHRAHCAPTPGGPVNAKRAGEVDDE